MLVRQRHDEVIGTSALVSESKFRLQDRQLLALAAPLQVFDQPVQRPDIVRMLGAALHGAAEAQIVAIGPGRNQDSSQTVSKCCSSAWCCSQPCTPLR